MNPLAKTEPVRAFTTAGVADRRVSVVSSIGGDFSGVPWVDVATDSGRGFERSGNTLKARTGVSGFEVLRNFCFW